MVNIDERSFQQHVRTGDLFSVEKKNWTEILRERLRKSPLSLRIDPRLISYRSGRTFTVSIISNYAAHDVYFAGSKNFYEN